jgi:hypothetical protein
MRSSYSRSCKYCGGQIQLRQTPAGGWVALEESNKVHKCRRPADRKQPVNRRSKEDIFKDITFPKEFSLKSEVGQNQKRPGRIPAPSQSIKKRGVKKQPPSSRRASPLETRRNSGRLSNGQLLFLSLVVLLILLSLWSR